MVRPPGRKPGHTWWPEFWAAGRGAGLVLFIKGSASAAAGGRSAGGTEYSVLAKLLVGISVHIRARLRRLELGDSQGNGG